MSAVEADPLAVVLARVAERWRAVAGTLVSLVARMRDDMGAAPFARHAPDVDAKLRATQEAVDRLADVAAAPEVVIATTGTTSAGKSTLANLLIGAELLPVAVQEMTAGVVEIRHHPERRALVVEETPGARWACGEQEEATAEGIQIRLEQIMTRYHEVLGEEATHLREDLAPPRFLIWWPTRIGARAAALGLPRATQLKLLDLPGLRAVGDETAGPVIRAQLPRALCLVAYDAHETDREKQRALLRQAVKVVKDLRGSPARMLFVLNKIDAFRRDRAPEVAEHKFRESITQQIRENLCAALPEYREHILRLTPVPLSSEPALLALLAEERGPVGEAALDRLLGHYAFLCVPPRATLRRHPKVETDAERRAVLNEVRHQARWPAFEEHLARHVAAHLPELIIPGVVEGAFHAARALVEELEALAEAHRHQRIEEVREALEQLEGAHAALAKTHDDASAALAPLRGLARTKPDGNIGDLLHDATCEVARHLQLTDAREGADAGRLGPLASALTNLVQTPLQQLVQYAFEIATEAPLSDAWLEELAPLEPLRAARARLRAGPLGPAIRAGEAAELGGEEQRAAEDALADLVEAFASAADEVVSRAFPVELSRVQAALVACAEAVATRLTAAAQASLAELGTELAGLRSVFAPVPELVFPALAKPVCALPSLEEWRRTEDVQYERIEVVDERIWYLLWLAKRKRERTVTETRPEERRGIRVPPLGELLEQLKSDLAFGDFGLSIATWIATTLDRFHEDLGHQLEQSMSRYRRELLARDAELRRGEAAVLASVERHLTDLGAAAGALESARRWRER